ncbi:unnamed protein product, partial [Phaeothamnion confervicola]
MQDVLEGIEDPATRDLAKAILRDEGLQGVQSYIKSQLAEAAAEELRRQREATEVMAKQLLSDILRDPALPAKAGVLLSSLLRE